MIITTDIIEKFFQLLQIAVGTNSHKDIALSDQEWSTIYELSCKQSLVAVVIRAADKLSDRGVKPPTHLLFQWIGESESIRHRNEHIDNQCEMLVNWFKGAGYNSCILKGQGVARLYSYPDSRQAGDIDIWVDANRDDIVKRMREGYLNVTYVDYVNCHSAFFVDTDVEVHFRPTWMFNPFINRKVQKWIRENKETQMTNYDSKVGFSYPTISFNLVFSLIHIYRHVFFEGIGLRQLMDYYYILTRSTNDERVNAYEILKSFGLEKFVGTVMYVLQRVFNIDSSLLLCAPKKEEGMFLLEEILRGGNFGHYDDRIKRVSDRQRWRRGLENVKRNYRFLTHYPNEVIWIPAWKIWHWVWRIWNGYLYSETRGHSCFINDLVF